MPTAARTVAAPASSPASPTIVEEAVSRLRVAIMRGELQPGQKLIECDLCHTLDISRASLREALRALEADKLVELKPNHSRSVARLSSRNVEAIHDVWALLAGEAVAKFTRIATARCIAQLEDSVKALRKSIRQQAPLGQLAATCQTAFKRDPLSASKRDPLFGYDVG